MDQRKLLKYKKQRNQIQLPKIQLLIQFKMYTGHVK